MASLTMAQRIHTGASYAPSMPAFCDTLPLFFKQPILAVFTLSGFDC